MPQLRLRRTGKQGKRTPPRLSRGRLRRGRVRPCSRSEAPPTLDGSRGRLRPAPQRRPGYDRPHARARRLHRLCHRDRRLRARLERGRRTGVWLPEATATRLRTRVAQALRRRDEARPEGTIAAAIAAITALLGGERTDLGFERRIDDSTASTTFDRRVYAMARTIPVGSVVTYGELAARVGEDASARAVGQSLGRNPFPIIVPCHRDRRLRAASSAAFPRRAASRPSGACWRSRTRAATASTICSTSLRPPCSKARRRAGRDLGPRRSGGERPGHASPARLPRRRRLIEVSGRS